MMMVPIHVKRFMTVQYDMIYLCNSDYYRQEAAQKWYPPTKETKAS